MGKKIKGWKRRKNKIFEDFTLLTVPKDSIWLLQHYFTLFWPYLYYIYTLWGRKSNHFSTQRGRKSKTRGGGERNQRPLNFIHPWEEDETPYIDEEDGGDVVDDVEDSVPDLVDYEEVDADDGVAGVDSDDANYANVDDKVEDSVNKPDNAIPKAKPKKLNSGCN